jgi:hypothetical protein
MNAPLVIPEKKPGSTWADDAHREVYLAYVIEGLSAGSTAKRLAQRLGGEFTKNQVVAYAHRNGWPHVAAASGPRKAVVAEATGSYRAKVQKPGPKSRPLAECDPRDPDGCLVERNCKFPVGKSPPAGAMAGQLFCGETPEVGPYCDHHAQIAYPPAAYQRVKERS